MQVHVYIRCHVDGNHEIISQLYTVHSHVQILTELLLEALKPHLWEQ